MSFKKFISIYAIFLLFSSISVFGQTRPTLAILPFTGGSASDGETIAELFSFDQTLNSSFAPVPRTSINSAIRQEQNFQMGSGMTDPETIARLGRQLGAKFIVSGNITRLGNQQLMIISIMQIDNLQQIAGDWRTYSNITEIRGYLPEMARNIVAASQKDTSKLQKMAVLPFQITSGDHEADVLAQILAIEVTRSGTYAVFPRTKTLEQVQAEYKNQFSGDTADEYIISIGRGDNPLLALSGAARRLGTDRFFNAAIINVESGIQVKGDYVEYKAIEEGTEAIRKLAGLLTGVTTTTTTTSVSANFVRVEGGTFQMGTASGGNDNERPVRQVTLKSFSMSKYPVTQKEWYEIMGTTIQQQRDMADRTWSMRGEGDNNPMYYVSWHEAIEYCNRRSQREGLTPVYSGSGNNITCNWNANGYRLPTEAEWEYAAKGGNTTMLLTDYSGSNSVDAVAWYSGNSGNSTKPVGTKAPNGLGIYDMSGNVWEWCWDWYGTYPSGAQTDPRGVSSGSHRVYRSGSWFFPTAGVRSAYRGLNTPSYRSNYVGFRVVRN